MYQGTRWILLKQKKRSRKSHAWAPLIDSGLNASRGSAGRSPGRAGREAGRPPLQEEEEEEEAEKKHDQLDHSAEVD